MLSLACHDIGIMDSEYAARGETEEELVGRKYRAHNKSVWHRRCGYNSTI
jgi:hypothetical protein